MLPRSLSAARSSTLFEDSFDDRLKLLIIKWGWVWLICLRPVGVRVCACVCVSACVRVCLRVCIMCVQNKYLCGVCNVGKCAVTCHHGSDISECQYTEQSIRCQGDISLSDHTDWREGRIKQYLEHQELTKQLIPQLPVFANAALMTHCTPTRNIKKLKRWSPNLRLVLYIPTHSKVIIMLGLLTF